MHLAWLTGQIDTWSVKMTPQFLNMCLQIFDTICMSGFTAGCFYRAISCNVLTASLKKSWLQL
jgi:hypothetical protein